MTFSIKESIERDHELKTFFFLSECEKYSGFFQFSKVNFLKLFLLFHFLPIQDQYGIQYCSNSVDISTVIPWDHKASSESFVKK